MADIDKRRIRSRYGIMSWDITDKGTRNFRFRPAGSKASMQFQTYDELKRHVDSLPDKPDDNTPTEAIK